MMMIVTMGMGMTMPVALAAVPSMKTGFTYSKDSDGVVLHSYNIGTNEEEEPFNFTVYHTRLAQSGMTISENTLQGKWRRPVGQGYITLWAGYMKNDIRNAGTYALMYDEVVGFDDHVWLSYGHDIVDTVLAHKAGIGSTTATVSYLHKTASDIDINVVATHNKYSDNNTQQIYNLAIEKKIRSNFKVGLNYGYSTADHAASPVYYVPINESVISLKPELTVPLGTGKMVIVAEQALTGHSNGSASHRHSIGSTITFGKFSVGTKYYSDVGYNARSSYINWDSSF